MRTAVAISASLLAATAGCGGPVATASPDAGFGGEAPAPTDAGSHDGDPANDTRLVDSADTHDANSTDEPPAITRPMVTGIAVPTAPTRTVTLAIAVRDRGSPTVELLIAFACDDDATWRPITTTSLLVGLPVTPDGVIHEVQWDTQADVDLHAGHDCRVKVAALDTEGLSSEPLMAAVPLRRDLHLASAAASDLAAKRSTTP